MKMGYENNHLVVVLVKTLQFSASEYNYMITGAVQQI